MLRNVSPLFLTQWAKFSANIALAARSNSPIRRLVLNDVGPFISWQALARLRKLHARKTQGFNTLNEVQEYIPAATNSLGILPS